MTASTVINDVTIRSAAADDFEWVADLMVRALSPFYDGDHRAHGHGAGVPGAHPGRSAGCGQRHHYAAHLAPLRAGGCGDGPRRPGAGAIARCDHPHPVTLCGATPWRLDL